MSAPPHLVSPRLAATGVGHGFFGRKGGVSKGEYESLNTGLASGDDPACVAENRARCAGALGVAPERLLTLRQVHSARAIAVAEPWEGPGPEADAMVTDRPGIALGALAADCMPILFADPEAGVIGAAHAGWRGALAGVLESTVSLMACLGAEPARIVAALGPCLRQPNFEVGLDLVEAFLARHPASGRFFAPGARPEKRQLDLAGFARWRLAEAGVGTLDDLGVCTLADPQTYFSYRDGRRRGADVYGRNLSAIVLPENRE
ncbi:MAG: peptidoglycan editing factor PgeF [Amphiplicatus sp.]